MAKINFTAGLPVTHDVLERNIAHAKSLGLPYVDKPPVKAIKFHGRRLAVVGGGHSVENCLDDLRVWDGDIWAINGACSYLRAHGIESTLLTLDPLPVLAEKCRGAKKALLCSRCDPALFAALDGADVQLFDLVNDTPERGVWASCATVMCAFDLATDLGYRDIVFFGCEGSYEGTTHAYMDDPQALRFFVECDGQEYQTLPELYVLTEQLAEMLRTFPKHFTERSGGLLRAMVKNKEHDITKVSRALMNGLVWDTTIEGGHEINPHDFSPATEREWRAA